MLELKREGKCTEEIARIFEVSTRTVQRALKLVEDASEITMPLARNDAPHHHCEAHSAEAIFGKGMRLPCFARNDKGGLRDD